MQPLKSGKDNIYAISQGVLYAISKMPALKDCKHVIDNVDTKSV